jgi:hypothetical protein
MLARCDADPVGRLRRPEKIGPEEIDLQARDSKHGGTIYKVARVPGVNGKPFHQIRARPSILAPFLP